jgi:hypothetical protein
MINSYWDLYVTYVNKCVQNNRVNSIDPHHYEMEWNHFLPQCIFGDQPVGHYLLLRQHSIASALQTLAFKRNCLCGWHIQNLPENLWNLCQPYYSSHTKKSGSKGGKAHSSPNGGYSTVANKRGLFDPANREAVLKSQRIQGNSVRDSMKGIHDPLNEKVCRQGNKKGGKTSTSQVWMSTADGYTSNAACVARHNRFIGEDPDARVRIK